MIRQQRVLRSRLNDAVKTPAIKLFPSGPRMLAALLIAAQSGGPAARANPAGATVSQGAATIASQGANLTVRTSDRAFINWNSFNIGQGETTTFLQPSSTSLVWNQINDPNPSQILGNLNANGLIVLQNQSGFFVGGQATITAHGLLMTTAPIPMPDLSSSGPWQFNAPPPAAKIINYGQINTDKGGSVFLIANDIENHGGITSPEGSIGLHAGQQVLVSERPNGLGLSAQVTLPEGLGGQYRQDHCRCRNHRVERTSGQSGRGGPGQFNARGQRQHRVGRG